MSSNFKQGGVAKDLQFGPSGNRLIEGSGNIAARNSDDTDYVNVRGATPVGANDLTPKQYVDGVFSNLWSVQTVAAATYTAVNRQMVLITGTNTVVSLPPPTANTVVGVKLVVAPTGNQELRTTLGATMDGTDYSANGLVFTVQYEQLNLVSDGTDWFIW